MKMLILVLISLLVVLFVLDGLYEKIALKGVNYDLRLDRKTAEIGEEFNIESVLKNEMSLPLDYVIVSESYPSSIRFSEHETDEISQQGEQDKYIIKSGILISNKLCLKGKSQSSFTRCASLDKRGRYVFHSASVEVGDLLGIKTLSKTCYAYKELVIFPKRIYSKRLNEIVGGLLGDISVRRFVFEDPVLTLGYREYTGKEPMKAISWTQSAKSNSIIVKKYDYTTELNVAVVLNLDCVKNNINTLTKEQYENKERAISITRVVCEELDKSRTAYSFSTNAVVTGGRRNRLSLMNGFGHAHLNSILESLGRIGQDTVEPISQTLYYARLNRQSGRTTVIITAEMNDELSLALGRFNPNDRYIVIDASCINDE